MVGTFSVTDESRPTTATEDQSYYETSYKALLGYPARKFTNTSVVLLPKEVHLRCIQDLKRKSSSSSSFQDAP